MAPAEGAPAPDCSLTSDAGETVSLHDLMGKPVVLYFYPKDDTAGRICSNRGAVGVRTS